MSLLRRSQIILAAYTGLVDLLSDPPEGGGEGGALLPGTQVPDGPVDKLQEAELGVQQL